jgi:hypothetical protein
MGHVGHFKPTHMFHPSSGTSLDAYEIITSIVDEGFLFAPVWKFIFIF